jgi:chromate transporter
VFVSKTQMARTFFRIGATAYGGPAIVAQIREVVVLDKGWVSEDEFAESLAFAQMLPGPVAVLTAAHLGWRLHGGTGTAIALSAYVAPSFLLMLLLSGAYFRFEGLPGVAKAFRGLGAAVVAIVAQSILSMTRPAIKNWQGLALAAGAAVAFFAGANPLLVLAAAALAGILAGFAWPAKGNTAGTLGSQNSKTETADRGYRRTLLVTTGVALAFVGALFASGILSPGFPALGATMAKINLLAFGGGYTAVALMFHDVVQSAHPWLTSKEFIDGLALGQITPGPVIITATFIGYRVGGVAGAAFATVCIFLPSSLLLVVIAPHFARVRHLAAVQSAVSGLLAAFIAMLLYVLAEVARSAFIGPWDVALAAAAFAALRLRVNVVWVVLGATAIALAFLR